ncbi:mannosyl-glycoprotein endo-beta-N-acetylglucosamidase, partial [Paenibacillus alvei]
LLIDIIEQHKLQKYDQMGRVEKAVIELNDKKVCDGTFANGLVTAPVRVIAEALGAKVGYDGKKATVNGKIIVGSQTVGGTAYAPIREIVEAAGGRVIGWVGEERRVTISK